MKNNALIFGIIIAAAIAFTLFGLDAADNSDAAPAKQWQHLAFETTPSKAVTDPEVSEKIVALGSDGWELVTVLNFSREGTTNRTVYYFRKPRN